MASNRHLGRIIVLQSLYEYEFRKQAGDPAAEIDVIVAKNIEPYAKALGDTEFVYRLARNVSERFAELDEELQPIAPEWPLSTIAAIDRNVLRMGLYELQFDSQTVPPKVAINEAVELAKAFGADNSSRFINGVLGTAYRQLYESDSDTTAAPKEENHGEQEKASEKKTDAQKTSTAENSDAHQHSETDQAAQVEATQAPEVTETPEAETGAAEAAATDDGASDSAA